MGSVMRQESALLALVAVMGLSGAALGGCGGPAEQGPPALQTKPTTPYRTSAVGAGPREYVAAWKGSQVGKEPPEFVDVTTPTSEPWLDPGRWLLTWHNGTMVYRADKEATYPYFTMRRYRGTAFGPDGQLPARYEVELTVRPYACPSFHPPIGENGILIYYLDPTHYAELNVQHESVSVWTADDARPHSGANWKHYNAWYGIKTEVGGVRHLRAIVDTTTHQIRYWVDGKKAFNVTVPMVTSRPHWFALRSVGNVIQFGQIRIRENPPEE